MLEASYNAVGNCVSNAATNTGVFQIAAALFQADVIKACGLPPAPTEPPALIYKFVDQVNSTQRLVENWNGGFIQNFVKKYNMKGIDLN